MIQKLLWGRYGDLAPDPCIPTSSSSCSSTHWQRSAWRPGPGRTRGLMARAWARRPRNSRWRSSRVSAARGRERGLRRPTRTAPPTWRTRCCRCHWRRSRRRRSAAVRWDSRRTRCSSRSRRASGTWARPPSATRPWCTPRRAPWTCATQRETGERCWNTVHVKNSRFINYWELSRYNMRNNSW